jgi:hypothetical protein
MMPTVHLNGTAASDLLEQALDCSGALESALKTLRQNGPNARDYYVQRPEDAFRRAVAEHEQRISQLTEMLKYYEKLAEHVAARLK